MMKSKIPPTAGLGRRSLANSICFVILIALPLAASSQQLSLEQAIRTAVQNNEGIKAGELDVEYFRSLKKTSTDIGRFSATWMHGQYNSIYQDNNFQFNQSIPFPTVMSSLSKLGQEQVIGAEKNLLASKNDLVFEVKTAYFRLLYLEAYRKLLTLQDSLYTDFSRASLLRFKTGEGNLLEKTTAESQSLDVRHQIVQNESDIIVQQTRLQALLKLPSPVTVSDTLREITSETSGVSVADNPRLAFFRQEARVGNSAKRVEQNKLLPDIMFGYFNQSLRGVQNIGGQDTYYSSSRRFQGIQLGFAIPLWITPSIARIKALRYHQLSLEKNAAYFETTLNSQYNQAVQESSKFQAGLNYYRGSALKNAALILHQAKKAFAGGEIGYIEYLNSLKTALTIRSSYLQAIEQYNQSVVKLEYLVGNF